MSSTVDNKMETVVAPGEEMILEVPKRTTVSLWAKELKLAEEGTKIKPGRLR
jgi:hypothetical protein